MDPGNVRVTPQAIPCFTQLIAISLDENSQLRNTGESYCLAEQVALVTDCGSSLLQMSNKVPGMTT